MDYVDWLRTRRDAGGGSSANAGGSANAGAETLDSAASRRRSSAAIVDFSRYQDFSPSHAGTPPRAAADSGAHGNRSVGASWHRQSGRPGSHPGRPFQTAAGFGRGGRRQLWRHHRRHHHRCHRQGGACPLATRTAGPAPAATQAITVFNTSNQSLQHGTAGQREGGRKARAGGGGAGSGLGEGGKAGG